MKLSNGWVVLVAMCLIGCGGTTYERVVGPDGRMLGVSRMTAPFSPKEAIRRAQAVAQRLGLKGDSSGFLGFGGGDWSVTADHYSASTAAKTAAGESVKFTATFINDGESELTVKSDLPEAQHKHLVGQIQAGMR